MSNQPLITIDNIGGDNTIPFTYEDEDSISDELQCAICYSPFIDPVEHSSDNSSCNQIFCYSCVRKQDKCPTCRIVVGQNKWIRLQKTPTSLKFIYNPLAELKVICSVCKQSTTRKELKSHVTSCNIVLPPGFYPQFENTPSTTTTTQSSGLPYNHINNKFLDGLITTVASIPDRFRRHSPNHLNSSNSTTNSNSNATTTTTTTTTTASASSNGANSQSNGNSTVSWSQYPGQYVHPQPQQPLNSVSTLELQQQQQQQQPSIQSPIIIPPQAPQSPMVISNSPTPTFNYATPFNSYPTYNSVLPPPPPPIYPIQPTYYPSYPYQHTSTYIQPFVQPTFLQPQQPQPQHSFISQQSPPPQQPYIQSPPQLQQNSFYGQQLPPPQQYSQQQQQQQQPMFNQGIMSQQSFSSITLPPPNTIKIDPLEHQNTIKELETVDYSPNLERYIKNKKITNIKHINIRQFEQSSDETYEGIRFENASYFQAVFVNCYFLNCNFINSNLRDSKFYDCLFVNCTISTSDLSRCVFDQCIFYKSESIVNCNFSAAYFQKSKLVNVSMKQCNFFSGNLKCCYFSHSSLSESVFNHVSVTASYFLNSSLITCDFRSTLFSQQLEEIFKSSSRETSSFPDSQLPMNIPSAPATLNNFNPNMNNNSYFSFPNKPF
ncbi:hypothetical protein DLAC_03679 [Tieghemostelium lacteum]|uniref:RING-type domain-containing protein n=1 Tax=Tieghemostelium lacteum TaxID=361077 RepID=A0A152A0K0_TIELA|nr:hypothetical protein DLAC_03679 [Tieghemostelium lacteum]|eukprot:KYQ99739.1 hypothetical protein DLAC_03679 [Tieghemostelium lacteum]